MASQGEAWSSAQVGIFPLTPLLPAASLVPQETVRGWTCSTFLCSSVVSRSPSGSKTSTPQTGSPTSLCLAPNPSGHPELPSSHLPAPIGLHPPISFHFAPAPKHPTVASTCVMSSPSSPRSFQQRWVLLNLSFAFKLNLRGHRGGCQAGGQAGDIPTAGMWADTEEMDGDPSIITPQQKETSNEDWRRTRQEEIHFLQKPTLKRLRSIFCWVL